MIQNGNVNGWFQFLKIGGRLTNLVTQALHPPVRGSRVHGLYDGKVQGVPLLERLVQVNLAKLGSHCRLRELGHRVLGVFNSV